MEKKSVMKNHLNRNLNDVIDNMLSILNAENNKSAAEKKAEAIKYLESYEKSLVNDTLRELLVNEIEGQKIKDIFWEQGETIYKDHDLTLRKVSFSDRDGFITLQQEYHIYKKMLNEESYRTMIWNEHIQDTALMLSILQNDAYIGYCGIINITAENWEIVIELMPEWTNRGIGTKAISAMLSAIKNRQGITNFRVRIDPINYPSQKLFEKLGAVPNGIISLGLNNKDKLEQIESENSNQIDEHLVEVAEKFGVEPSKLLSHVLEYNLSWD